MKSNCKMHLEFVFLLTFCHQQRLEEAVEVVYKMKVLEPSFKSLFFLVCSRATSMTIPEILAVAFLLFNICILIIILPNTAMYPHLASLVVSFVKRISYIT